MKKSLLERKQIPECAVELAGRLVKRVAWPERRQAMAEVTLALLDGKARTAEEVFGWGRSTVKLGLKELRVGIVCVNDLSKRRKPKSEEKHPKLLVNIRLIMDPNSAVPPSALVERIAARHLASERAWLTGARRNSSRRTMGR
jgi:hypothetical protein